LEQEAALDQQFASHSIAAETLKIAIAQIGATQVRPISGHIADSDCPIIGVRQATFQSA
jgi:hypothetical protein